jgi:hypothetical protein
VVERPDLVLLDTQIVRARVFLEEGLAWDEWYERVGKLGSPYLVDALEAENNPGGNSVVNLIIRKDHSVSVALVECSNKRFGAANLNAYRMLDGSTDLAFPEGSSRVQVEFEVVNQRYSSGPVSDVNVHPIRGDMEVKKRQL